MVVREKVKNNMKKTLIIILIILIIVMIPIMIKFSAYKTEQNEIKKFNLTYEKYKDKNIYGAEVGSIINSAINNNKKNEIEKDENNRYIDDNKYCLIVGINIPIIDEEGNEKEDLYSMEAIEELGVDRFVKNFSTYEFTVQEIKYNQINRINYIKIKTKF